jgi:uncharacterized protein
MNEPVALGMPGHGSQWPDQESIARMLASPTLSGWRPTPFRQFVLKIHSRCDLACDYCYMYEMADQSWRDQPARGMSRAVIDQAAVRIAEHARAHRLAWVEVVLHGGEPLLAGADQIDYVARTLRDAIPAQTELRLAMTTNGIGLDSEEILRVLQRHRVRVAVSLDGDQQAHDRHRRFASGQGSHELVVRGIQRLRRDHRGLLARLSTVIDVHNDPIVTYRALAAFDPPQIDLLLPHHNWDDPPAERSQAASEDSPATPYADWLIAVFDHWYHAPHQPRVGLFAEILALLLGGQSHSEAIGLSPVALLVIESNGDYQQVDSLKSAFSGAPQTGLTVFGHSMDVALAHPAIIARQIGVAALCDTCQQCPVRNICGGGLYVHRYRHDSGYLNPSVYSPDLQKLIEHIQAQVQRDKARLRAH